jgi:2'-5' RNA ligase
VRAFVAVWPPPGVVRQLAALDRPALPGWRWATEDQWHVTLRFLGELGAEEVERGKTALQRLGPFGRGEAITAVAGPALKRLGPAVLSLLVAGLDEVAAQVVVRTASIGAPPGDRPFVGHLTLARAARRGTGVAPPLVSFSASWPVDEVTLVASTLRPDGARYQVIGRYSLAGSGPGTVN